MVPEPKHCYFNKNFIHSATDEKQQMRKIGGWGVVQGKELDSSEGPGSPQPHGRARCEGCGAPH